MKAPRWRNTWLTSRTDPHTAPARLARAGVVLLALAGGTPAHAARHAPPPSAPPALRYGLPAACLTHVIAAPLLTNSGSPIIPATFNDMAGLAYVSVTQDEVGVYAPTPAAFPVLSAISIQTIAGVDTTYTTVLHELRITNGRAGDVPALLEGTVQPRLNDQPVLGVIGYDILGNYDVLFDFPARVMVLFLASTAAGCPPLQDWLGPDSMALPLQPDRLGHLTGISMQAGTRSTRMEIEPGADMSSLSRKDARALGLTPAILHDDIHVRTNAGKILNGRRHHFDNIAIGAWHDLPLDVNVEKTSYSVLGMNFLRRRRVLMAFPQGMMYMTPQADMPNDHGQAAHGMLTTRTAIARLIDAPPTPPAPGEPMQATPDQAAHPAPQADRKQ
ncbi:retroviral-like aspartic protease family protein [Komagataeibacter melomenusus]|nr:retropepsin-like aspartic protease [Komagataeibacter melomenusus]MBV1831894.1 retroviral-like aspartic protease family protein [Komagataeibacter melomenusus]